MVLVSASLIVISASCDLPRDPEKTLETIRARGEMRVGVTEAPPWVVRSSDAEPAGVEAELIRELARNEQLRVRWVWGPLDRHYAAAEAFEIDLVAGGITEDSPWHKRVGFTAPYFTSQSRVGDEPAEEKHVLVVPPGENAWLARVESHLRGQEGEIAGMLAAELRR